ncbi:ATP-binding protein [Bradyrhizobium erythrophlei]|uniref:Helicase HerA central domain-containing protein n=1 Tax=Bradyrhizobium erythrophlei TaxID=1437360 RepID=A0A1H4NK81_9BRAD|nr:DUF87 domain-containing protein [Bradyrhizobium erythrophlei]SEB95288.1 protein of unknown function DUF87 [Bradyrhizobium erythrophlei]
MTFVFPRAVLEQHTAFLGKTGSGKTSTAKLAVEQILTANPAARVCVLDPIKSDWWGMTSSADGQRPGLPFYILGGPRGHVPLHDSAGKAIGELVATGDLPLSIIDMADFNAGGLQKFFNDFAPALMKRMRRVVYLVIEEAHEFAPKERAGIGAENLAIHNAKKLATAGRSKGIRLMVVTQRTQALHNAVLGSCDTMIAHRLTAPADQDPVKKWLKANVDKVTFERVSSSLASLKTGTGWICSGEAQVADMVQFPKISSFDNSATPTDGDAELQVKTAAVDRNRLRAIIGDAVRLAEENDVPRLRAEIARLESQLGAAAGAGPEVIAAARQEGFERARREASADLAARIGHLGMEFQAALHELEGRFITSLSTIRIEVVDTFAQKTDMPASPVSPARGSPPAQKPQTPNATGNLPGPQQRVLNSLATWAKMGHDAPANAQVAWLAGYSPTSSSYANPRSGLKTAGLIDYPRPDCLTITPAGRAAANPIKLTGSLLDFVLGNLGGPESRILGAIAAHYPKSIPNAKAAEGAQYSATSSSYANPRSALRTKDLITYPEKDHVRAADWLFAS